MSLLEGVVKEAFTGIKPSWRKLFLGELKPYINMCFKQLGVTLKKLGITKENIENNGLNYYIRPGPENILNAFRFCEVEDVKCVIVGQDPYPDMESAHGLSFSIPKGEKIPGSLSKIYDCLYKQELISKKPINGNLEEWAKQGVLLLNRYLTRNPQIVESKVISDGGKDSKNIHTFWGDFTGAIIKHLCTLADNKNSYLCLMLWGQKAQEIVSAIPEFVMNDKISIKTWGHPSKASPVNQKPGPKNFDNCTHFKSVNEELKERGLEIINWDPQESIFIDKKASTKVVVFTDGGCIANGKPHAKASYGVYFPKVFNKCKNRYVESISGLVPNVEILNIENGIIQGTKKITPSNNRGELLAVIIALDVIIRNKLQGPWMIVMDSEYCMHIINERIWKWHKKDSTFSQWANSDLVSILYKQLLKLQELHGKNSLLQPAAATYYSKKTPMNLEWNGLTILHQESHKNAPTDLFKLELWEGNNTADRLCNALLNT